MKIQPWERSAVFPDLCDTLLTWRRSAPDTRELPWRDEPTPYHVWISEIMLQQTRANVVRGYYLRFLAALPTVRDLADVDEDALMKLWQGLGYYSRARNLKRAAQACAPGHRAVYRERNLIICLRSPMPRGRRQLPPRRRARDGKSHRHRKGRE